MRTTRRPPSWAKGCYVELRSGKRLALALEEKGWSQRELARYVGLHDHSHISRLIAGRKRTCEPVTAERIAKGLGVDLLWLFQPKPVKSVDVAA